MTDEPSTPSPRWRLAAAVLVAAVVALAALGSWHWVRLQDQRSDETDRTAVLDTASSQALTLLGVSQGNVSERLAELQDHSTGDFKKQLAAMAESFSKIVKEGEVTSTGEVVSSAVADLRGADARVLLALSSEVTNSETKKPEARAYRITVDLRKEDGTWLVSGMQFAP